MDDRDAVNDIDADGDEEDGEDLFGAELLEEYVPWHFLLALSDTSFLAEIMLQMSFLIGILTRVSMMMKMLKICQLPLVEQQK